VGHRVADVGDEQPRGPLALGRPEDVGGVEERQLLRPEGGVVDVGVALDLHLRPPELEAPVRRLLAARAEDAVDHLVGVVAGLRDLAAGEIVVGLDLGGGVRQRAGLGLQVELQGVARHPARPLVDDDVAGRLDDLGPQVDLGAVGREVDVLVLDLDVAGEHGVGLADVLQRGGGAGGAAAPLVLGEVQVELDAVGVLGGGRRHRSPGRLGRRAGGRRDSGLGPRRRSGRSGGRGAGHQGGRARGGGRSDGRGARGGGAGGRRRLLGVHGSDEPRGQQRGQQGGTNDRGEREAGHWPVSPPCARRGSPWPRRRRCRWRRNPGGRRARAGHGGG